ncbi:glycoside hydrolase family 31 protein [Caloramator sp. CAR-1]|uniref:glycoside hydrolase family 31 protein n=1 Tax=Caloramator sp. CAR-1 TaxID=3062777 RepID=UPI0026E1858D|nr:glycoside hydrolase family 31 protein [Caloramator sp. CAR-1]MDO6354741.1 glycoside hydrolase family 31 protein [Caloramator sp. CAR-1]
MFGKIMFYFVKDNKLEIQFENGKGFIEVIKDDIINVFSPLKYEDHFSRAIEGLKIVKTDFHVNYNNDCLILKTDKLIVKIHDDFKVDFFDKDGKILCEDYREDRKPFIRRGNGKIAEGEGIKIEENFRKYKIEIVKKMQGDEYFYGLGEKTGYLNKRGYYYEMWNTDDPRPHVESYVSLYKSIPFFITLRENASFGIFFDNTFKTYFDMGKENGSYYYFAADDGNLDYYFINGPKVTDVVEGYTYLTGKTPLPQLWTLGYQQSRWSYSPKERVLEIAKTFREKDIPCDVIHLDIDYMDGYRVFTWDKVAFSNHKEMIKELKNMGFKVVTIIDPGVKKDKGYFVYEEGLKNGYFATDKDGIPYVNEVWPGEALYPDFSDESVRRWWAEKQKIMLQDGVAGIWNDMNEPASFKGPLPEDVQFKNDGRPTNHLEIHNVYGHLMSKATYEGIKDYTNKRPFVITRACYAGTQKYSTVWTGDNHSFWEHLRMAVPMLLNLGLSGIAFCGTDVGGFQFDATGELLSRWVQLGCFTPLFRNHSCIHTRDQEPWAFDEKTEEINRKYIKLRYKLLPYVYDLMYQCELTGLPLMRPLFLHYQDDKNTYELNDEFLFGENILVAPILEQGKNIRAVYLPEGTWIDYWTKEEYEGGKYILKEAPLDICPIFIKKGSIIPNFEEQNYVGQKKMNKLILDIYPGDGAYYHYKDDGESFEYKEGKYNLYKISMRLKDTLEINIEKEHEGYDDYEELELIVNNYNGNVVVNSKQYKLNQGVIKLQKEILTKK